MPDAYLHIRTARAALKQSGCSLRCLAAYEMGANGPDPLFSYQILSRHRDPDLYALAERLHSERAGAFLMALATLARGDIQRSFAAGFIMHNTLDSLAHPYVAFLCESEDGIYHIPNGHCFYESALDCVTYRQDTGDRHAVLPLSEACPVLSPAELGETTALLQRAIFAVFGEDIPFLEISDSYRWFHWVHRSFRSRYGFKKLIARLLDAALHKPGFALSHMQPCKMKPDVPDTWRDPYTGELHIGGMAAIVEQAEHKGSEQLRALCGYWKREVSREDLAQVLGNASYNTGLPC